MANFGKLKQRLGRRRGFDGNEDRLGDFINDAYLTICSRRPSWSWLRQTHQFLTHTPESVTASPSGTASGVATSGAVFTNGSRTVTGLTTIVGSDTRSGAKILAPDGTVNRVLSHNSTTTAYMEALFGGTTSSPVAPGATPTTYGDSWKIYWDEYPLPYDAAKLESITMTGNGFTVPVQQISALQPHMSTLPINGYESHPTHYSVVRKNPIPPAVLPLVTGAQNVSSISAYRIGSKGAVVKYRWCYYNSHTLERGALSPVTVHEIPNNTLLGVSVAIPLAAFLYDYGIAIYRTNASTMMSGSPTAPPETPEIFYHHSNFGGGTNPTLGLSALSQFLDSRTEADRLRLGSFDLDSGTWDGTYTATGMINTATGVVTGGSAMRSNLSALDSEPGEVEGVEHMRLWPPPDAEYLVDISYFRTPQDLANDQDVPLVPRMYHSVILDLAEALALSEEENHSGAGAKRGQAMEMLARMEREEDTDPGTAIELGRGLSGQGPMLSGNGRWPKTVTGG